MTGTSNDKALALQVRNVSVAFNAIKVLRDVSLEVESGTITGLIGPNGAGKTTLVNVMSGFQKPSSGNVVLGDTDLTGLPAHKVACQGISRSFQGGRLFSRMTVFENVLVAALGHAATRAEAVDRTLHLLRYFGLSNQRDQFAEQVPYGDERLLSVARSLAAKPRILLLDEPAAGLNEAETKTLKDALKEIPGRFDCGMMIVEHDMDLIMSICHNVWVLANGANLAHGTPAEISAHPRVIQEYLGAETDAA